jgi:hypothetical protein
MPTVLFQQESYKRRLVLGLTMAKIVLLVLFTLLLALSAVLVEKEGEAARLSLMEKELSKFSSPEISDLKKFFEELIIARDKAVQRADQFRETITRGRKATRRAKGCVGEGACREASC